MSAAPHAALLKAPIPSPVTEVEFNRRILIVEDEDAVASAYKDILTESTKGISTERRSSRSQQQVVVPPSEKGETPSAAPFEVTVTRTPEEAIEAVRVSIEIGRPFAVGFFDVMLGGSMDGIELVRRILKMDPQIFAVFVTAYQDRSVDAIQGVLGASSNDRWDYLNKPFSQGEILQKARNTTRLWNLQRQNEIKSQALLIAQEKLLESERTASVAAVARGVGHEFGNILHQIMGRAELSLGKSQEDMGRALDTILLATERAAKILDRFKDLSSPVGSDGERTLIALHQPIEEALLLVSHQLTKGLITTRVVVDAGLRTSANPTSLVQVFVNLCINALHAMPNGGRLEITSTSHPHFIEIQVRDTGTGIPEELLEKVTEPFFTTKGKAGTGLGLAICREVVEIEHGGEFLVENHPSGGALFRIRLPVLQSEVTRE